MSSSTISALVLYVLTVSCIDATVVLDPAPQRYAFDGGRMVETQEWQNWKSKSDKSVVYNSNAIPIVSDQRDAEEWRSLNPTAVHPQSFVNSLNDLMKEEVAVDMGLSPTELTLEVFEMFKIHEMTMGTLTKLMQLQHYDTLCFLIDDSLSMGSDVMDASSDVEARAGELGQSYSTRWTEACNQVLAMLGILKCIPKPMIDIHFLCRNKDKFGNSIKIVLDHKKGQTPAEFYQEAKGIVMSEFKKRPSGDSTPMLENITKLLNGEYVGKKVVHYWFGDGVPTNPARTNAINEIKMLVKNRPNPASCPITFVSCSDRDKDIEWMKEVEEIAPYCAELDDFISESDEVRKDQGDVFPYNRGIYLVSLLVGAMNPNDLDALDESVPLSKATFDDLMGLVQTEFDYRRYFEGVVHAQENNKGVNMKSILDNYEKFLDTGVVALSLECVKDFRDKLKNNKLKLSGRMPYQRPLYTWGASSHPLASSCDSQASSLHQNPDPKPTWSVPGSGNTATLASTAALKGPAGYAPMGTTSGTPVSRSSRSTSKWRLFGLCWPVRK